MSCKGFTLIEVLIVVVIAVVVTMFSVPAYKKSQDRARYMSASGTLMDLANAVRMLREDYPDLIIDTLPVTANAVTSDEIPTESNVIGWLQSKKYLNPIVFRNGTHQGYAFAISTEGTPSCSKICEPTNAVACMYGPNLLKQYQCVWVGENGLLTHN